MMRSSQHVRPVQRLLVALLATTLGACTQLTDVSDTSGSRHYSKAAQNFEQQLLERARRHTSQGMLAEASTEWELLTLLRPDQATYASNLTQARAQIEQRATELGRAARQAQQKGALDEAAQRYLALLAIKPADTTAADALRTIERERVKREVLGRYARQTIPARAASSKAMTAPMASSPNAMVSERNELEHASLLAGQGDFDDAVALLNQRLKTTPSDSVAKALLADVYYRKGTGLTASNKTAAIAAVEDCLRLDPKHTGARKGLAQLKPGLTSNP
jgi:tetratricopeptide (TPR) repeat protein